MRKERKIINTNIRLNLCDEQDRQAWEYLQTMDREKYKSYTRAVVVALNDYFSREYRNEADPYLETREKEDAFVERIVSQVTEKILTNLGWSERIRPDGYSEESDGNACTVCKRIGRRN
mgnify:CR=1 FL=1